MCGFELFNFIGLTQFCALQSSDGNALLAPAIDDDHHVEHIRDDHDEEANIEGDTTSKNMAENVAQEKKKASEKRKRVDETSDR